MLKIYMSNGVNMHIILYFKKVLCYFLFFRILYLIPPGPTYLRQDILKLGSRVSWVVGSAGSLNMATRTHPKTQSRFSSKSSFPPPSHAEPCFLPLPQHVNTGKDIFCKGPETHGHV